MIEEQFVSFGTAKLLKEAGFDEVCRWAYDETRNSAVMHERNSMLSPGYVSRPTQALAARWLREEHHLNVYACFDYVCFDDGERKWFFMRENTMINDYTSVYCSIISYDSYEQALEAGLREAIKLIKKIMIMSKQCLDVHQMQHLQELGLDTSNASMYWISYNGISASIPSNFHLPTSDNDYVICDAYTLQDVLDALPNIVLDDEGTKYYLQIEQMNSEFDDWRVSYKSFGQGESPLGCFQAFHLIDAAVRMLVHCFEQGYVKTNK